MQQIELVSNGKVVLSDRLTLDDLWEQAVALGDVAVNDSIFRNGNHVRIKFKRKSGSTIWAEAEHTDIRQAFATAIEEARQLGAT